MGAYDILFDLSEAQAVSASAASTNYVDMEVARAQAGNAGDLWVCVRTHTAPTAVADTIAIIIQHDADDGAGSPVGTWADFSSLICGAAGVEIATNSANVAGRVSTAGDWVYRGKIPYEVNRRYVRLYYSNAGTSTGTQTYDAWIQTSPPPTDRNQVYVSNVSTP